ncbi:MULTISPECIES: hypothetical protein [Mycolicibacterium]|uniref:hypothetical protein n=1 Tax=Mycolicibacterium TaxID=1866885 RepID=UPI00030D1B32|nr:MULTISPECIES: hypothetical protein [Mycolicibacterium]MCV7131287.1 hypothetical protein [Mycolicibacterium vanbaalenii PYR-1]QZY44349.1 hypothetical protein K5L12_18900 [Mycolicibacterium austroafricanum]
MKSALAVSCHGPRASWNQERREPLRGRLARRCIVTALLLALGLAVLALLVADPAAAHLAGLAGLPHF